MGVMNVYDAVVVGAGPNGLAAAVTLAEEGKSVLVVEGAAHVGGGTRTAELTLPGFRHDVCSAVHPFGIGSPFLRSLPLERHGLRWVHPDIPLGHPLDDAPAAMLYRSIDDTAEALGPDGPVYRKLFTPLVDRWDRIERHILGPLLRPPRRPISVTRFGLLAARSARSVSRRFRTDAAKALFAGNAAHAFRPLGALGTAGFGLTLMTLAHRYGWPFAAGGSQAIADALASYLRSLGGEIQTGWWVEDLAALPRSRVVLVDLTPKGFLRLATDRIRSHETKPYRRFRHGPAAFKIDYALDRPVPWADPRLSRAGTLHLGGTFGEIAKAERAVWKGRDPVRPFVLVAQPSLFDPLRAPDDKHTLWVYAHVPNGSDHDFTEAVEAQIERFAPGFAETVLARHVIGPATWPQINPNYRGGDISGGAHTLRQLLFRPVMRRNPYQTPLAGVYLCSSSTPPGAGVHGMCGFHAARSALRHLS